MVHESHSWQVLMLRAVRRLQAGRCTSHHLWQWGMQATEPTFSVPADNIQCAAAQCVAGQTGERLVGWSIAGGHIALQTRVPDRRAN